jgi:hypothetical protein
MEELTFKEFEKIVWSQMGVVMISFLSFLFEMSNLESSAIRGLWNRLYDPEFVKARAHITAC